MPIREHRFKENPPCPCCGHVTRMSTAIVDTAEESGILYFACWTPESPGHGIAFLVGMGDPRGFVSVIYDFRQNSFTVVGPDGYDWQLKEIQVMQRDQVIGTELAPVVFRTLDEIWMHDSNLLEFVASVKTTMDRR